MEDEFSKIQKEGYGKDRANFKRMRGIEISMHVGTKNIAWPAIFRVHYHLRTIEFQIFNAGKNMSFREA
uniref:Uncharacterized protein n=2 Tax=Oryza TaxID=4527 RepID=Q69LY8_ORYSJ|nr:hypothetical protein [Oryza sativa Japonica Group]BAD36388.1 hypothetical protein [Oryza sativa Japonica Group]